MNSDFRKAVDSALTDAESPGDLRPRQLPEHASGAERAPGGAEGDAHGGAGGHGKGGKPRLVVILVGLALLALGIWAYRAHSSSDSKGAGPAGSASAGPGDRVVPVTVATVEQKDLPLFLEGLGNAVPLQTVTVHTLVDGRLDAVNFTEGQKVKKGDLLAQVDPRPFTIQLHTAEAALARDSANLRNARLNLDRYEQLRKQNLIPTQQVSDQQALAEQADATVRSDQASIESARLNLDYARIVSPLDGVAGVRQVDPGNIVHPADTTGIVVLTQLDPMAVVFTLPQDDLARVNEALQTGEVPVDAYARDGVQKLGVGKLALIDNQINQTTATIRLKAFFPNPKNALWPNEFVKARMLLSTLKGAVTVPAPAVQRGPQGSFVYVVGGDKTVSMRSVEVDVTAGDTTVIAKGVSVGDVVVTDGQNQLRPGSKVAPRATEASSGPGGTPGSGDDPKSKGTAPAANGSAIPGTQSIPGVAPGGDATRAPASGARP